VLASVSQEPVSQEIIDGNIPYIDSVHMMNFIRGFD
jgi:hypothetical protein